MSVRRFAGYFFALVACATAAFSSLPNSADSQSSFSEQRDQPIHTHRPVQVALAR